MLKALGIICSDLCVHTVNGKSLAVFWPPCILGPWQRDRKTPEWDGRESESSHWGFGRPETIPPPWNGQLHLTLSRLRK